MNKIESFEHFLTTQSVELPLFNFVVNLVLTAILSWILSLIYVRFGNSLSNRGKFSINLIILAMVTMLIIAIVKSSLALSLGLVGALSIVRFRSAIKEPEELLYLFFSISIGLGFGADQRLVTFVAFIIILIVIILLNMKSDRKVLSKNMNLIVNTNNKNLITVDDIVEILKQTFNYVNLKRYDENSDKFEASFIVSVSDFDKLSSVKKKLYSLDNNMVVTFLDINIP